jgi:hypothetical protein
MVCNKCESSQHRTRESDGLDVRAIHLCLGVVAIANKSESHEDSKENFREQNVLFNHAVVSNPNPRKWK